LQSHLSSCLDERCGIVKVVIIVKDGKKADDKAKLKPQVLRMADLVDYQKGSVVSRTIVDKKAGTVTLFAFDKGEGLSEHAVPYDALVYLLDGVAEVKIEGTPFLLKEGEFVVMLARKPHALRAVERFKMVLIMVHT
jgi:quercetin dioxygenase-like cupin family protein